MHKHFSYDLVCMIKGKAQSDTELQFWFGRFWIKFKKTKTKKQAASLHLLFVTKEWDESYMGMLFKESPNNLATYQ